MLLDLAKTGISVISPAEEIAAYEAIWTHYSTFPKVAELFRRYKHALPSKVAAAIGIPAAEIARIKQAVAALLPYHKFSALFYEDFEYPERLKDARHPVEVLYYRGALDLLSSRSIAVVGARKASENGIRRARKLARFLVENDFTVMSGLAEGIDTAAHTATLEAKGRTIAVIGTALNEVYPRANYDLQKEIARNYLLISQVPFYLYSQQDYRRNRFFFPERNKTMSALSEATVIVEASESSGSLTQAEAAIQQKRKLFILDSCFKPGLDWPEKFLAKGAIRLVDGSEILEHLAPNA
ncbi:MAG TPA: DNA-protecting protein DprA [Leptolyngbyaceae cyanobacterium M33_DOE_097]|uniref:DNA-processing protein DprA n=1 Tax=Oscillatoriales cyanobacterium SpSt-418 TaxID=2282169 RepID=A0A7C3PHQ2_9CYAN|nr:DNA-protecting protein DprA [Leptolyngbyaceae cyanobacterium M33_DOE_097]